MVSSEIRKINAYCDVESGEDREVEDASGDATALVVVRESAPVVEAGDSTGICFGDGG